MATSQRDIVDRGLVELRNALKPICERSWSGRYGSQWLTVVNGKLKRPDHDPSTDDPAFLLKGIIRTWDDVWSDGDSFGFSDRELDRVWEIKKVRHRVAHHKPFTLDNADRALVTIERLLAAFEAREHQGKIMQYREALLQRRLKSRVRSEAARHESGGDVTPGALSDAGAAGAGASGDPTRTAEFSNHERVELCLRELETGLRVRCRRKWSRVYGNKEWRARLNGLVSKRSADSSTDDLTFLLQGIIKTWDDAWSEKHGNEVRGWVSEAYRGHIHANDFDSFDDAHRMLDTIERILRSFGAMKQKRSVNEHRKALLHGRHEPMQAVGGGSLAQMEVTVPDTESVAEGKTGAAQASAADASVGGSVAERTSTGAAGEETSAGPDTPGIAASVEMEEEEGSLGLLGAAFLSAGFRPDGSRLETEPEPPEARQAPVSDPPAAPAAKPREVSEPQPTEPEAVVESPASATGETLELFEDEQISPYDKPGSWYVIHAYSGYEKKVKARLATRIKHMHLEDRIFEVVIPTEKVVEIKGGRKVEVEKRMFPGYLLIRMDMRPRRDPYKPDPWKAVRDTPGVTSFVGMGIGAKPTYLSKREVERFLGLKKEAAKKPPRFRPAWEIGETVRVSSGPFADFNGVVEDINVDRQKVTVLVEIFGRDTPMELGFEEIQKQ